jgi:hypothetical protein
LPGKGSPFLKFRIPRKYDAALRLDARRQNMTVSELGRRILRDYYGRVWDTQSSGVGHLGTLCRMTKQYITLAQLYRQATKVPMKAQIGPELPGSEKRDDLEVLVWRAIQEAVTYSKTEDAAKDAEARLLALQVANALMRTELAILKQQDDAFVGPLLEELGLDADGLERKTRKGS